MKQGLAIILSVAVCTIIAGCTRAAQPDTAKVPDQLIAPSGEPTYPIDLTPEQKQLLTELGDLQWFTRSASKEYEERKQQQYADLLHKAENAGLPKLAKSAEIKVSESEIKNISGYAVLIVLQHETGRDVAVRTHWLPAGQAVPSRSAFRGWGKVWIVAPRTKEDTEQQDELDKK